MSLTKALGTNKTKAVNEATTVEVQASGPSTLPVPTRTRLSAPDTLATEIKSILDTHWLPRFYREQILPLRTRAFNLPEASATMLKPNDVTAQHTLLGVELKIGRRRVSCPDLATARYLAVFARARCAAVAVPYDISRISLIADELESGWQRMLLLVEYLAAERSRQTRARLRSSLIEEVRRGIAEAGAGTAVPQFNQNTKQRG